MIDTHCHLTSGQLLPRVTEVIEDAAKAGVDRIITVATDGDDAMAARELATIQSLLLFWDSSTVRR